MLGPLREDSPRRIGPYGVRARLGAGGMGEVFLGVHDDGGDPVAVKTVRRDVARDPGFRNRFRREITVARSVSGPHLALLLDGDADAEVPWLATGYVAGPTLSAAVRRAGAMDEAEVRMLGAGLARALAAVHAAGIVHRDVKPGNVMLAADGPSLIDFGIARDSGATPLTTTSRMVGSPAFMSPEHVAGSGRVVPASDVFCLASVLCYAVTGRDPFGDGPVAAVLYRVKYVEADLDDVPDALRAVLERCLVADPAARPAAAELAELLDPGAAGRWPDPVAQHIAEHERELARVTALGRPLLPGYTPTEATADSRPELHQLPTQGTDFTPGLHIAPTQGPGLAPPPRRSRRALAVSLAALIVLGAATGGILAWRNKGGEPGGTARGGGSPAARIVAGIDENGGPDASGTVPYGRDVRPAGWKKSWKGKFTGAPIGCSAGRDVVVCRKVDGTYEALSAADGHRMWTLDSGETGRTAGYGPRGQFFMPAGATRPTVYDDTVLLAVGDRLQSLDARTGRVRWETRSGGAHNLDSAPVVVDGLVFAATTAAPEGAELAAYDLRTGVEKWREQLAPQDISNAQKGNFWPVATDGKVVYAVGEDAPRAFRPKDGKALGTAGGEAVQGAGDGTNSGCGSLRLRGRFAFCTTYVANDDPSGFGDDMVVLRFAAGTLRTQGRVPVDSSLVAGATLTALDDRVITIRRGDEYVESVPDEVVVVSRDSGRPLGRFPLGGKVAQGMSNPVSAPMIDADTVVWADSTTLYTVPMRPDGSLGPLVRTRIPGAPGPTRTPTYDSAPEGVDLAQELLDPQMLPVGGVVHVVYDDGTAVSVPLPG
ncbi:serine/threonine-protein kinase [Streptomyces sp. NBC_00257]|uniref:serine/threonine-protein kinase n=1 Tax=unclassified Streptomyces TaxID=2593676 RepID=UPI00225406EF|nr:MULTISPECIES: serine/threonine-protein kinase [unclassified Streptomyces]MCX4864415.1 serine/threonine-protein kinase [Streptomyces sp. NBC_00906]MCX4895653.1 serine/threonine-protein kinase [Streptomyces sp. NBC_00892]MCX5428941.1 serine/threonine-protein kinase [Streptomyces sp. NBC_00062]